MLFEFEEAFKNKFDSIYRKVFSVVEVKVALIFSAEAAPITA